MHNENTKGYISPEVMYFAGEQMKKDLNSVQELINAMGCDKLIHIALAFRQMQHHEEAVMLRIHEIGDEIALEDEQSKVAAYAKWIKEFSE